jgi:hypothetical protein
MRLNANWPEAVNYRWPKDSRLALGQGESQAQIL